MKSKYLLLLAASTLVLGSCVTNNQSNDSESTSDTTPPTPEWDADIKEAFEYYAGEVLPYVDLFADTPELYEDVNDSGMPLAILYDDSDTNKYESAKGTLKGALEGIGWTVVFEEDEDGEYIYATNVSEDELNGYEILYYYGYYGNTLQITNWFMSDELLEGDEWGADIVDVMVSTIDTTLPFMAFGADLYAYAYDEFTLVMYDSYYHNLTDVYVGLLSEQGFQEVGYELVLETESYTVSVELGYYYGNEIMATYTPKATEVSQWPLDVIREYLNTNTNLPAFALEEEGTYSYYIHGDALYIETERTTTYENTYAELLKADTDDYMVLYDEGFAGTWYENYFVEFEDVSDDSAIEGFRIILTNGEPCNLYSSFPVSLVEEALGVTNLLPEFSSHYDGGYKFGIYTAAQQALDEWGWLAALIGYTEEEIIAYFAQDYDDIVYVQEYTVSFPNEFDSYVDDFSDMDDPWYLVSKDEEKHQAVFEDRTGAVQASFFEANNVLSFNFYAGSGIAHERTITLNKNSFKGLKDATLQLEYELEMLPDNVVFESSNEDVATVSNDGLVTIVSETLDETAVITASVTVGDTVYKDECVVLVKDVQTVTDTLNQTAFGLVDKDTNYADHTYTSTDTHITYSAYCASAQGIQLRVKNSNSGIVGGASDSTCQSISVTFGDSTESGKRAVEIYASNTAFTIADMYAGTVTKVATLNYTSSKPTVEYEFEEEYSYIGIKSESGAVYLTSIVIDWAQ